MNEKGLKFLMYYWFSPPTWVHTQQNYPRAISLILSVCQVYFLNLLLEWMSKWWTVYKNWSWIMGLTVFHQPLLILTVYISQNCTSKTALYASLPRPKMHSQHIIPIHTPSRSFCFPNRLAERNITRTRPMNKQGQGQSVLKHTASFRRQEPWVIHELCLR